MTEQTLLSCPFCGAHPTKTKESLDERYAYADVVIYECPQCACRRSAVGDTSKPGYADNSTVEMRALAAWNRRAHPVDAPRVPDTHVIVPKEPTYEMKNAAPRGFNRGKGDDPLNKWAAAYRAMIAAAQKEEG